MKNFFKNWTPFKKRYFPIITSLAITFILSLVLIFAFPTISSPFLSDPNKTTRSGWPARLAAPYIDMSSWVDTASAYSNDGAPNLELLSTESGFKYFNLGFIQPDTTEPLFSNGKIKWGWGGYYLLSPDNADNKQYQGIVKSLTDLRSKGGDYTISIGGQLGKAPWAVSQNQEVLETFYEDIISTYSLKRMDLDIEEENQDYAQNIINAKAIKNVQDKTNIEITLTIPIMPSGWQEKQINILKAYIDSGVDIALINSMTMCYGAGVYENEDYGTASIRAITNSISQMKELYSNVGINLTNEQAYLKTGATFSIGYENSLYPVFTLKMAETVVDDAIKNNYGMVSMWSMGRDAMLEANKVISTQYNYTNILKTYSNDKT